MQTIQFTQWCSPYNAGEVAGFSDEDAARYVAAGMATLYPLVPSAPVIEETQKAFKQAPKDKMVKDSEQK